MKCYITNPVHLVGQNEKWPSDTSKQNNTKNSFHNPMTSSNKLQAL